MTHPNHVKHPSLFQPREKFFEVATTASQGSSGASHGIFEDRFVPAALATPTPIHPLYPREGLTAPRATAQPVVLFNALATACEAVANAYKAVATVCEVLEMNAQQQLDSGEGHAAEPGRKEDSTASARKKRKKKEDSTSSARKKRQWISQIGSPALAIPQLLLPVFRNHSNTTADTTADSLDSQWKSDSLNIYIKNNNSFVGWISSMSSLRYKLNSWEKIKRSPNYNRWSVPCSNNIKGKPIYFGQTLKDEIRKTQDLIPIPPSKEMVNQVESDIASIPLKDIGKFSTAIHDLDQRLPTSRTELNRFKILYHGKELTNAEIGFFFTMVKKVYMYMRYLCEKISSEIAEDDLITESILYYLAFESESSDDMHVTLKYLLKGLKFIHEISPSSSSQSQDSSCTSSSQLFNPMPYAQS